MGDTFSASIEKLINEGSEEWGTLSLPELKKLINQGSEEWGTLSLPVSKS